jgi:hypothetical protein
MGGEKKRLKPATSQQMMKAISLWQPWATLVAIGAKKIETRSWPTKYRGPLAIHASAERKYIDMRSKHYTCDKEPFYTILMNYYCNQLCTPFHKILPRGAVIAICELVNCFRIPEDKSYNLMLSDQEKAFGDYTSGRFMWIFGDIYELPKPITVKGKQGLWDWNGIRRNNE